VGAVTGRLAGLDASEDVVDVATVPALSPFGMDVGPGVMD